MPACRSASQKSEMGWRKSSSLKMIFFHVLATEKRYSTYSVKCSVLDAFTTASAALEEALLSTLWYQLPDISTYQTQKRINVFAGLDR